MRLKVAGVSLGVLLFILCPQAFGQAIDLASVSRIGLEISDLNVQVEIDSLQVNQVVSTYDLILPEPFENKLKSSIRIGKILKSEELDGCLDGLGHDVSIILRFRDGNQSEIFFGCDDYRNGTLRMGNDYSKFWKATIASGFLKEFEAYVQKAKTRIAQNRKAN